MRKYVNFDMTGYIWADWENISLMIFWGFYARPQRTASTQALQSELFSYMTSTL